MPFSNTILASVLISGFLSQLIKIFLQFLKEKKKLKPMSLLVTGGMPSTHSALVSSLLLALVLDQGWTGVSVLALVIFIVVVTDAMGVRRTAGEEGKLLNEIIKRQGFKLQTLNYALGHKPKEVFAGILLGFVVTLLLVST